MIIKNVKAFDLGGEFIKRDLYIKDGIFTDEFGVKEQEEQIIDATGQYAIPGLVDIHFHGAVGCDWCDADEDGLKKILEYELNSAVMAVCPATMTYPEEHLNKVIDNSLKVRRYEKGADLIGINMEGPFINKAKAAAQNPRYIIKPDADMLRRLIKRADGLIRLVDIAPELPGAVELITEFKDEVAVSIAHSECDYETAKRAFLMGASQLTHMFNAMNGIHHRAPGPILAAYEEGAFAELICDGVHVHDAVIRMAFDLFGQDRVILISDSMMAAGLSDGQYVLGGRSVDVKGNMCCLSDSKETIAGSNTNLYECMKHAVINAKVPLYKAVKAATYNPAGAIRAEDKYGSLDAGHRANVLITDEKLNIKHLIKDGIERSINNREE